MYKPVKCPRFKQFCQSLTGIIHVQVDGPPEPDQLFYQLEHLPFVHSRLDEQWLLGGYGRYTPHMAPQWIIVPPELLSTVNLG